MYYNNKQLFVIFRSEPIKECKEMDWQLSVGTMQPGCQYKAPAMHHPPGTASATRDHVQTTSKWHAKHESLEIMCSVIQL